MGFLKFGWIRGGRGGFKITLTDAEVIKAQGGRFLTRNATTGLAEIADTTEDLIGHADHGGDDSSTSSVEVWCVNDLTAVFRLPLIYDNSTYTVNYAATIDNEACDLKVVSNIQYVNPTVATNKSVIIVGGQAATGTSIGVNDGYIDCQLNFHTMLDLGVGA